MNFTYDELMILSNSLLMSMDSLNGAIKTVLALDGNIDEIRDKNRELRQLHKKICKAMENIDKEN